MSARLASVFLLVVTAAAQVSLSIGQLKSFLRSSVELRHDDKRVADYLKRATLTERLDSATRLEMLSYGVGPKTAAALEILEEKSGSLSPPPTQAPKPPAVAGPPPPGREEQAQLLALLKEYAGNYTKRLPDFICTQVTRRYVDPTGLEFWQREDVITTKLTYFEQKEDYKVVLVNSHPVDIPYDRLGGATSAGEFGSMLREIFEDDTKAQFAWLRWATLRGRRNHVIEYSVAQPRSKWRISYQRTLDVTPAYHGLIYVDRDTGMVTRVTLEAVNIPPSFPIQEARTVLDYDFVKIGEAEFLLPLKSEMRMREGRLLVKNEVEFRLYRKFGAEAVITFDTPEPLPEEKTKEQPPAP